MIKYIRLLTAVLFVTITATAQNFDINTLKKINLNRNTGLDKTFITITNSGNYIDFGVPSIVTLTGLLTKNKQVTRRGIYLIASQAVTIAATQTLKRIVNRPRPWATYPYLQPYEPVLQYSLPSGHTSSVFAMATSVSVTYKKWYIVAPAYSYATLVAYSRMHLGVHYPSDVLAGAVLGASCAIITNVLQKRYFNKKKNKYTIKTT